MGCHFWWLWDFCSLSENSKSYWITIPRKGELLIDCLFELLLNKQKSHHFQKKGNPFWKLTLRPTWDAFERSVDGPNVARTASDGPRVRCQVGAHAHPVAALDLHGLVQLHETVPVPLCRHRVRDVDGSCWWSSKFHFIRWIGASVHCQLRMMTH